MVRWVQALAKTRQRIAGRINQVLTRSKALDDASLEDLEACLLLADVAPRLVMKWLERLEEAYSGLRVDLKGVLRQLLVEELGHEAPFTWAGHVKPHTLLVVGVNGSGKTTTCAKIAHTIKKAGHQVLLGAADTFRAAGSEQLRIWAERIGCDVVSGKTGADAAAVAFDALDAAVARDADFLVIDTAGRMHTKRPLMDELSKVGRALTKRVDHAPDNVWAVLDASMGQNAITQAKTFNEAVPLTGVVVAKLDGSSKAGFIFSIQSELGIPIQMVGLGEEPDDLVPFNAEEFVDALLDEDTSVPGGRAP